MGAVVNVQEDGEQLALVHAMPKEARKWIQHHFGNALAGAMGALQVQRYDLLEQALDHAIADLRQITPPAERIEIQKINLRMMEQRERR